MRFEKWQALGNDYVIVERDQLRHPADAAPSSAACAPVTWGSAPTGSSSFCRPTEPGYVAQLRILNPDGSEAELSGNGAREALLYLVRAGWTDARQFSIQTIARRDPRRRSPHRASAASTWAARR